MTLDDRRWGPGSEVLSSVHHSALGALTKEKQDGPLPQRNVCPKLENLTIHAPSLQTTKSGEWVELIASRRGNTRGAVAFLKAVEICLPDLGSGEQESVLSRDFEVFGELARRDVRTDGIEFCVEKDYRWTDYHI